MDHVFAGKTLRLTYVRDQHSLDELSSEPELEDAVRSESSQPDRLGRADHLVLATNRQTGQVAGILVGRNFIMGSERFLLLEKRPDDLGDPASAILQRMFAVMLMRIISLEERPDAVVTYPGSVSLDPVLRSMQRRVAAAELYPQADPSVIPFALAALACRIGRTIRQRLQRSGLALLAARPFQVLDLRQVGEPSLIDGVRRLYRTAPPVVARKAAAVSVRAMSAERQSATGQPRR